eukprot:scpid19445/ scgid28557/ Hemicentin-1; Fibulin-6
MDRPDQRRLNDMGIPMNPYRQPYEMTPERRKYFRTWDFQWSFGPDRFFTGKEHRPWEKSPLANRFILHDNQDVGDLFQYDPSYVEHPFFLDPVVIEWTVDGVPITNQNGTDHWMAPNGTLMLFNLKDYHGSKIRPKEYRCLATNSLGTIISRPAFIGMAFLDQYPIVALKRDVQAVPSNTIALACPGDGVFYKPTSAADPLGSVVSRPPPFIQWIKDGSPVNNTRARLMPSGDLQIDNYQDSDAGTYQCRIRNSEIERRRNEDWGWERLTHSWRLEQWQQLQDFWSHNPPREILVVQEREWRKAKWLWNLEQRENRLLIQNEMLAIWEAFRISPPVTLTTQKRGPYMLAFEKLPPTRSANPLRSLVGGSVVFEAVATALPDKPTYEWTGPNGQSLPFNRTTMHGGNLHLHNVQKSDEGFYRVTATANGETTSHLTHLSVYDEPVVSVFPQNTSVMAGTELNITCEVSGLPAYQLSWYHNGIEQTLNLTNRLYIEYVNLTLDGYWQCFIFHEFGVSMGTMRLNVLTQPVIMENPDPHIVVHEYEKFSIGCAVGGHPLPSVTWMKNNETLEIINGTVNDTWSSSTISVAWNLTEVEGEPVVYTSLFVNQTTFNETGQYRCFANNSVGVTASHPSYVDIYGPPRFMWFYKTQFAETGKPKIFELFVAGLPMPQVEWTYPPGVVPGRRFHVLYTGVLKIDIVHPTDYGVYHVKFFNKYGMVETDISFEVVVQPEVVDVIHPGPPVLGEDYWIVCDMYGKPPPNITWMKSGERINGWNIHMYNQPHPRWPWLKYTIQSERRLLEGFEEDNWKGSRSNITIRQIHTDDLGMYSCGSETHAGEYYRRLRVTVDGVAIIPHELDNIPNDVPTWGIVVAVTVGILVLILLLVLVACCARRMERSAQRHKGKGKKKDIEMPRMSRVPAAKSSRQSRTSQQPVAKQERVKQEKAQKPFAGAPDPFMPPVVAEKPQRDPRAMLKRFTASRGPKERDDGKLESMTSFDEPPGYTQEKKSAPLKFKKSAAPKSSVPKPVFSGEEDDDGFQMPKVRTSSKAKASPSEPFKMPPAPEEDPPSNIATSYNYSDATTV